MRGREHPRVIQQRGSLHDVRQLADVARPPESPQRGASVLGQRLGRQAVVLAGAGQEVLGQAKHIGAALAQRGHSQGDDGEPVIEVLPESPGPYRRRQILARRRHHPDVEGLAAGATQPAHGTLLDHP
jgi:hypothetical protein